MPCGLWLPDARRFIIFDVMPCHVIKNNNTQFVIVSSLSPRIFYETVFDLSKPPPHTDLPFWKTLPRFVVFVLRRTVDDDLATVAASMSFTSIMAMVPVAMLAFAALSYFEVLDRYAIEINQFIFKNFVPASGEVVQTYLLLFVQQAAGLTRLGTVLLGATAVMLLYAVDHAINGIWGIKPNRSLIAAFFVYTGILLLGPLLLALSFFITTYIMTSPFFTSMHYWANMSEGVLPALPFLLSIVAFTGLFALVPKSHVDLRHALTGAVVAAFLFEGAKWVFTWYVTRFSVYEVIYGTLASVPLFLIWLYISWLIILFGAEIVRCIKLYYE